MTAQPGVLAVIPARGGSKGLPGKNIRPFVGLPLIAHTIMFARMCPEITRCIVSTDSEDIADVARQYNADVPFLRPPELAIMLLRPIAAALMHAHEEGVIHRDLKPANILLTKTGQTRITDFGLAKQIGDQNELTVTGDVVGTPSYMSPEQINGNSAAVGVQSDVYSLGAILYCLLTGRPPFQAATILETFTQLTQAEPVPPRQLVPTVSPDLETVCLKCLQKSPAKRYLSTAELLTDLDRFLEGKPVQARPVGQLEHAWRWCQRKPLIAGLSAAVGLLVCIVAIVSSLAALHHQKMAEKESLACQQAVHQAAVAMKHLQAAEEARQIAQANLLAAQTAEQTAQSNLYAAHMNLAQMALRWILDFDAVTVVIPGSKSPNQVPENVSASQSPSLSKSLHAKLNVFYNEKIIQHIRGKY